MQSYNYKGGEAFNADAIFSDTTDNYVTPSMPEQFRQVEIRLRTARNNVDRVFLFHKSKKLPLSLLAWDDVFDYYHVRVQLEDTPYSYYFKIVSFHEDYFYNQRGLTKDLDEHYNFTLIPGLKTAEWARGAVFYQIFTDRFCNGDTSNDVLSDEYSYIGEHAKHVDDWNKYPDAMDVRSFYGGDLQGVLDKLDYLKDLGVEVIYFNPLFVSPSNHKYDIQDYDHIDPHFGPMPKDGGNLLDPGDNDNSHAERFRTRVTDRDNLEAADELFIKVIEEAHSRSMKVILDGVFNHCGSFNKWLDRELIYRDRAGYEPGAYISHESPYGNYFHWHNEAPDAWPCNTAYDGWWGHDTLPKLNYEGSRQLQDYILYIGRKWVSRPFNADGWRLDVAADLGHSPEFNHHFWEGFRKAVRQANPNAIVLAEHYGSPREWLFAREWDTVMNYDAFMEPVSWFLTGMEKHSDDYREDLLGNSRAFFDAMRYHMSNFPTPSLQIAMNELSNHDHSRFLTRTNHKVGRTATLGPEAAGQDVDKSIFRNAVVIQMTWPGAPTLYYGDEAGVCGFTDPDNRRTYPWGHEDTELIDFHRSIISMKKAHPMFRTGSVMELGSEYGLICYGRFDDTIGEQAVVIININDSPVDTEIPVWRLGTPYSCSMRQLFMTDSTGFSDSCLDYAVNDGILNVQVPARGSLVLSHYLKPEVSLGSLFREQDNTAKKLDTYFNF